MISVGIGQTLVECGTEVQQANGHLVYPPYFQFLCQGVVMYQHDHKKVKRLLL